MKQNPFTLFYPFDGTKTKSDEVKLIESKPIKSRNQVVRDDYRFVCSQGIIDKRKGTKSGKRLDLSCKLQTLLKAKRGSNMNLEKKSYHNCFFPYNPLIGECLM